MVFTAVYIQLYNFSQLIKCLQGTPFGSIKNEFYLRRIHSLLGIIPIGAFLIVHLLVNHQATQGRKLLIKPQVSWNQYRSYW